MPLPIRRRRRPRDQAAPNHERRETEDASEGLRTRLHEVRATPPGRALDWMRREFWGLLLAYLPVRGFRMHCDLRRP